MGTFATSSLDLSQPSPRLPVELLSQVFLYCPDSSLCTLLRTSRLVQTIAAPVLYHTLTIDPPRPSAKSAPARLPTDALVRQSPFQRHTKRLRLLAHTADCSFLPASMSLPNLEVLTMYALTARWYDHVCDDHPYCRYLAGIRPKKLVIRAGDPVLPASLYFRDAAFAKEVEELVLSLTPGWEVSLLRRLSLLTEKGKPLERVRKMVLLVKTALGANWEVQKQPFVNIQGEGFGAESLVARMLAWAMRVGEGVYYEIVNAGSCNPAAVGLAEGCCRSEVEAKIWDETVKVLQREKERVNWSERIRFVSMEEYLRTGDREGDAEIDSWEVELWRDVSKIAENQGRSQALTTLFDHEECRSMQ